MPVMRLKVQRSGDGVLKCTGLIPLVAVDGFFRDRQHQVINSKIKDNGIFAQWLHNYSISSDDFRMVFRTFAEGFPGDATVNVLRKFDEAILNWLMRGNETELRF